MAGPMKIRATLSGAFTEIRVLMTHPMETGQRKDPDGKLVPPHFIQNVTVTCAGRTVLTAQWGTSISKNPFMHFRFKGGKPGDKVAISWVDNKGERRTDEAVIAGG